MDNDTSYVLSGSSSLSTCDTVYLKHKKKKSSTNFEPKYKQSIIKKRYGRKKRKKTFYGTLAEAQSLAKKSPTKTISSLKKQEKKLLQ